MMMHWNILRWPWGVFPMEVQAADNILVRQPAFRGCFQFGDIGRRFPGHASVRPAWLPANAMSLYWHTRGPGHFVPS
jgi:hypothetical protein